MKTEIPKAAPTFNETKIKRLTDKRLKKIFGPKAHFIMGKKERFLFSTNIRSNKSWVYNEQGNYVLRIDFKQGDFGPHPGLQWVVPLASSFTKLSLSYDVFFSPHFDFAKGGKLPGLAGGVPMGGGIKPDGKNGWSARYMFQKAGRCCSYLYHVNMLANFGEKSLVYDGQSDRVLKTNQWQTINQTITLNDCNESNGILNTWIDNVEVQQLNQIKFRNDDSLTIDKILFSCFFGGASKEYAPKRNCYILFRNFKTTEY
jgi:hypothetical protein